MIHAGVLTLKVGGIFLLSWLGCEFIGLRGKLLYRFTGSPPGRMARSDRFVLRWVRRLGAVGLMLCIVGSSLALIGLVGSWLSA